MSGWYWVIPICLLIIGFYGMFWIMAISTSDIKITIKMEMDNNTLAAFKEVNQIQGSQLLNNSNLSNCNWTSFYQPEPSLCNCLTTYWNGS